MEERYFFDNEFLKRYLETGSKIKVFVDQEYIIIASPEDVADPTVGTGYTLYGEPREFDYRAVDAIKINTTVFTVDQLQQAVADIRKKNLGQEPETEEPKDGAKKAEEPAATDELPTGEPEGGAPAEEPAAGEEAPEEEEPKKEESVNPIYVRNIDPQHPNYRSQGTVALWESDGYVTYETWDPSAGRMKYVFAHQDQLQVID